MDIKAKGWIKQYLHIRNQYALQKEFDRLSQIDKSSYNSEEFLYQLLQPTGIMYGHPAKLPLEIKSLLRALRIDQLSDNDKTRILLLESFLHSALSSPRYNESIEETIDLADATLEAALMIGKFYKSVYQGLDTSYQQWFFRQERKGMPLSEYVIENKVEARNSIGQFWSGFFNSSLSFLDLLYFRKWISIENGAAKSNELAEEHEHLRFFIFQIIICAALANDIIELEERHLFESYIQAVYFSEDTKQKCQDYLENPTPLDQLDFSCVSSRVVKKYILELAALVIYSDKIVTSEEMDFLHKLCKKLGLGKKEREISIIAVESFIASYWQQIEYLQKKEGLNTLEEQVLLKLKEALIQHEKQFALQVKTNGKLALLLAKAQREKLTNDQKNVVQKELKCIIRELPSPILHSVSDSFYTYPLLMQMLPDTLPASMAV